ncbi:hypothetical protein N0V88_004248 [Collariella sp. IMI 366227]|nr:hypothetical protein N0V88_004248 [Collariella sp. IMI 366227]
MLPEKSILKGQARTAQSKTKAIWTALTWTIGKEARAKLLLDELREYKSTITLAITAESGLDVKEIKTNTLNIKADTEDIKASLTDVQQDNVYQWLSGTDSSLRHEDYGKKYEAGTGEWLFRFPSWTSWLSGKTRALWVHGIPGAGKSTLAYRLIEQVEEHCVYSASRYACAYYYCYFGHSRDETIPFLASILHQLCRQYSSVPGFLYDYYKQGRRPTERMLLKALENLARTFDRVFIVIDAVDESLERENLLGILRNLASDSHRFGNICLLATSRKYIDIEEAMTEVSTPISMQNEYVDSDIVLYVKRKLEQRPKFRRWPETLRKDVLEVLSEKANGMFRWVACQIKPLERLKPDIAIVRSALADLPKDLDETYERAFQELPEDAHLFVKEPDVSFSSVSFAHYSVFEYLESSRIRKGPAAAFAIDPEQTIVRHSKLLARQALGSVDKWTMGWPETFTSDLYTDFGRYCVHSCVLLLQWHTKMLTSLKDVTCG